MSQENVREVVNFNVELRCDRRCENCERFFDCNDERKYQIYRRRRMARAVKKMAGIKHKISISGGKGGVGKSTVSVNLAAALAMMGRKVTILDQDFDGSSVPRMLGLQRVKRLRHGPRGIIPVEDSLGLGMQAISLALVYPDEVITMFHEMRRGTTEEFVANVDYGERDYLIVDLPPGTSSDACNLLQYIPDLDGTVTVTVPPKVSQLAARRATILSAKAGCKVLGIIENMSGYICGDCGKGFDFLKRGGGEELAQELGVPFLGRLPLHPEVSQACDEGVPFVYKFPQSPASKKMMEIAQQLEAIVAGKGER
ncbi:MAG: ATP-binding protein [Desulforudis sp.]|jgi:Mrp family chromosome partitioning ATPase|nr:MAG: ATP-binding protein [Desulforudis sp.]